MWAIVVFAVLLITIQLLLIAQPEHFSSFWRPKPVPKKVYVKKDDEEKKEEN